MTSTADIVIIGGGVQGCSLAFHLAQRKAGRIVLLEKNALASGPTAKSGAMIRPLYVESIYIQLILASTQMFENWNEVIGGDAGFVQNGVLRITKSLNEADIGTNLDRLKSLGAPFEILSADQMRRLIPAAEFAEDEMGLFLPKGGFADPYRTTLSLAKAAQRLGVEICEGISVTGIEAEGGRVQAVQTNQGRIATRVVVNSAGVWSPRIAAMVGLSLPIEVWRVPTQVLRRPEAMSANGPIISDTVNWRSFRYMTNDLIRVGPFSSPREVVDPDNWDESVTRDQLDEIRMGAKRCPTMQRTASFGGFSALYDMMPDGYPIVSPFPQVQGFWCNCGWSGIGFAPAPAFGRLLAQRMIEGKSEIDLGLFEWPRRAGVGQRAEHKWNFMVR